MSTLPPPGPLSPDGLHYWDGRQWLSTLSPDGRFRWNGSAWIPTGAAYARPPAHEGSHRRHVLTSWTKPLQIAVVALFGITLIDFLALPFGRGINSSGASRIAAVIGFVISLIVIVGALNRWIWLYRVLMWLLGLGIVALLRNVSDLTSFSAAMSYVGYPVWTTWLVLLQDALGGALSIAMLYALVKRGPWGMTTQLASAGQQTGERLR